VTAPAPLLLTPGCPLGIGPEVAVRAAALWDAPRPIVLVGDGPAARRAAAQAGVAIEAVDGPHVGTPGSVALWAVPPSDEPAEILALRWATSACLDGRAAALVTGPIHKARLSRAGFPYLGHTDFLGDLCGVPDPVMAFVGGALRVALVTVHLPLRAVPDAITAARVEHTLRLADAALREQVGCAAPKLAVCGLNPHAGDEGALGHEEGDQIAPAVARARQAGIDALGPMSAEAAFLRATRGEVDMVVAMYHDQGLAPLKAVDFGRSVNWTLGLPIVRTSVDHGTADDLVGTGLADPASMSAALRWADTLATAREAGLAGGVS
jgi:4-hydroxythreonine-4-phosphate dehydrogenase